MEGRIKDLEDIKMVFDSHGIEFFVVYGAALGFTRDKNFIPHDDDIDLAVTDKIDFRTRKKIGHDLLMLGFVPQPIGFNVFGEMEPSEPGYNGDGETGIIVCERNFKFTIFFFKEEDCPIHGREMVCIPKMGSVKLISSPAKFYTSSDTIKIGKKRYKVPHPIKDYLDYSYYNNWRDRTDRRHSPLYTEVHPEYKYN